jgi:AraC-like DNA-binding protein
MVIIPQRLVKESFVDVIHHGNGSVILAKKLDASMEQRTSYVSMHALSWIREGTQVLETPDDSVIRLTSGHWVLVKRGVYTISDLLPANGKFASLHVFFSDLFVKWVLELLEFNGQPLVDSPFYKGKCVPIIQDQFEMIEGLGQGADVERRLEILRLLVLVVQHGLAPEKLAGVSHQPTSDLLTFMHQNYSKPFTVDDYAYLSGRSTSTFRREFRTKLGTSPQQWIIQRRMEKAMELVQTGQYSVGEVSSQVGYENVSHFIGVFKRTFGQTPKQLARDGQVGWKKND